MSSIIKMDHVTKDYGYGRGIFDISFEVEEGEVFGYVGTNGAGKTTTIRNMLGFVFPDSGEIEVAGLDPRRYSAELMNLVAYVPGEIAFPNLSTGTAFLKSQAEYNKITDFTYTNYVADKLGLDTTANLKRMSKGMKQKTAIVAALMANRDILVLDEPTTGLDPLMRDNFLDLVREEKQKGRTIFMSGHIIEELEEVCDKVAMIRDGRVISILDMHKLRNETDRNFVVTLKSAEDAKSFASSFPKAEIRGCEVSVSVPVKEIDRFFKILPSYELNLLKENNVSLYSVFMEEYTKNATV